MRSWALLCAIGALSVKVAVAATPVLPRHPAPSPDGERIAFSWQGDLWIASATGAAPQRLTANPGYDHSPLWFADGLRLAFSSDREGSDDVFVLSLKGGTPRRLTYHEAGDLTSGVLGDDVVFVSRRHEAWDRMPGVYRIPSLGGTEALLVRMLALEAVPSPDGSRLALVRGDTPTERRHYRGAANRDLWLFTLATDTVERLTATEWDEDSVSWAGDSALVFRSDNGGADRNVFRLDLATRGLTALTHHQGDDVRRPRTAANGTLVAYELFDSIWTVPADGSVAPRQLVLDVPADSLEAPVERRVATDEASEVVPSPEGSQVALVVQGDVFVVARRGKDLASVASPPTARITSTAAHERDVTWSPDGKTLTYASDRFGQYELFSARAEGRDDGLFTRAGRVAEQRITDTPADELVPGYSPDGTRLAFVRGKGSLVVASPDGGNPRLLFDHWDRVDYAWSPDSRWLAFSRSDRQSNSDVFIVPETGGDAVNISQHPAEDGEPRWSPDGRRLYWVSSRHARTADLWAVYLTRADHERTREEWLQLFEDEEGARTKTAETSRAAEKPGDREPSRTAKKPEPRPVVIDLEGIHERARSITALPGDEGNVAVSPDGKTIVFSAAPEGERDVYRVRWDGKELKRLTTADVMPSQLTFSKDGKSLFYRAGKGTVGTVDLEGKSGDPVPFAARLEQDRAAVRAQVFEEAWRELDRWFYDPAFHGTDWQALRDKYRPLALAAPTPRDFADLMNLMVGELNSSHQAFRLPRKAHGVQTGDLGIEIGPAPDGKGVLIAEVLPNTPASRAEVGLKAGDRILAVNGIRVDPPANFFSLLVQNARERALLRVASAVGERDVQVTTGTVDEAREARYRAWVRQRRAMVEKLSGGRLGYIHIQGMDAPSLEEFERDLYAAANGRQGLLIDVRNNGGGWTTDHLLAILSVRRHAWTVPRDADPLIKAYPDSERLPLPVWTRPAAVLCDQSSYSNAEIFSWAFQTLKRGPVIGQRTFGAVISTDSARLVDGSTIRLPSRGWYVAGTGVNEENHGCSPDVRVEQPPEQDLSADHDDQLARAVEVLLAQLPQDPATLPW